MQRFNDWQLITILQFSVKYCNNITLSPNFSWRLLTTRSQESTLRSSVSSKRSTENRHFFAVIRLAREPHSGSQMLAKGRGMKVRTLENSSVQTPVANSMTPDFRPKRLCRNTTRSITAKLMIWSYQSVVGHIPTISGRSLLIVEICRRVLERVPPKALPGDGCVYLVVLRGV